MILVNQISNPPIIGYCLFNIYIEMTLQIKVRILEPDCLELDPTSPTYQLCYFGQSNSLFVCISYKLN